jgi:hypothetical protein
VQELCDLFPANDDLGTESPPSPTHSQLMVHLSVAAAVGAVAPKTLCLTGQLQQHPISILVDSGSSHTFLSTKVAATLSGVQQLQNPISVQVANGEVLHCVTQLPTAEWSV